MNRKNFYYALCATGILMASCTTPKNVTYFQNLSNGEIIQAENMLGIKVKPEDKLTIMVNCQDPALSSLFNLVQIQNRLQSTT
ncbi:MAG: hypothetical protein K2M98_08890, partial [Muribaculum sp.]|nr:hypothetical protein [Muribaculum sp.]